MDAAALDERVAVVPYDPAWAERFERERERVSGRLEGLAAAIEHIGSTSVPGLQAKPIVDLLVGVVPGVAREAVVAALEPLGYEDVGLYLRRRGGDDFNANLVEHDGAEWKRELLFRDYLRAHPDDARAYGELKIAAAARHGRLLGYAKEKRAFISGLIERACRWRDHGSEQADS